MAEERSGFDWSGARQAIAALGEALARGGTARDSGEVLAERAKRFSQRDAEGAAKGREIVVFRRGTQRYGVPIEALSAVRRAGKMTEIPGLSAVIRGVVNERGRLITVHDLSAFGKTRADLADEEWILIGYGSAADTALLADEVEGVSAFNLSDFHDVPVSLAKRQECFLGFSEEGIAFINLDRLIDSPEFFAA